MHGVLHTAVSPKFTLDVFVTEDAHILVEEFPVRAEEAAVEGDGWKQCQWSWFQSLCRAYSCWIGEKSGG